MSFKFSTALRNKLCGGIIGRSAVTYTATTIAAVDGGESADSLTDSANGFVTAGISVGDSILVTGFTGGAVGLVGPFQVVTCEAGTITVPTGSLANDAAGESVSIIVLKGQSIKDVFKDGVIKIYSGAQPASADAAVTGTLLVTLTLASGAWVAGTFTNGIEFGVPSGGIIAKDSGVWSGLVVAAGIAGYWRFIPNASDPLTLDSGYLYPRIDGSCGLTGSGADMIMSAVNLSTVGATVTIDTFQITFPASA